MDQSLGFTEVSKRARQVSFVYGKLRRAELERNVWTFATRQAALRAIDTNTMLLSPSLWVSSTTYFVGSIVNDGSGTNWISRIPNNLGNQPQNSGTWEPYFGPMAVPLYDATGQTAYYSGEVVYTTPGDGTALVYLSRQNNNSDVPSTATIYDPTVTYFKNQVVTFGVTPYMSLIDLNLNNEPDLSPAPFSLATSYSISNQVAGSNGLIYTSIANGNVGNDPTVDGGVHWSTAGVLCPWTSVFIGGTGSDKWLLIGGTGFPNGVGISELNIIYPLGAGPQSQVNTLNLYRLPSGYLRKANQDPKAGSYSDLGAPTNSAYDDWVFENGYIISSLSGVIVLRFVADVQDVTTFKTMFCEGLGARIAKDICREITGSTEKVVSITQAYDKVMGEARLSNAIEEDSEEAPLDDWLAVRA